MLKKQNNNHTEKKSKILGPIIVIGIFTLIVMILSLILSLIGFESQVPVTDSGMLEMQLITVNNIFSIDGIKFLLSGCISNFRLLQPLVLLIVSLISVSIAESSGLIKHLSIPLKRLATPYLICLTLIFSIALSLFGDYSFILLLPLVGIVYKYAGRNPMLGILTVFVGIACSYGTGIIYNYNTYLLGTITQISATIDVDPTYTYDVLSCLYIMVISAIIIIVLGTIIINKYLAPKFDKVEIEPDEIKCSNRALWITNIITLIILIIVGIMILPGGLLLDNSQTTYIAKLMSDSSPFYDAFIVIILASMMICGGVYGKISGNIKNRLDYNVALYKSFDNTGYVFVLMFFNTFLTGILSWTNIGNVFMAKIVNLISGAQFSGGLLIVMMFVLMIIVGIVIPDTYSKWKIAGPLIVPLFMRSNITPEFTQFIFGVSDGLGKALSPIFIYFIITLGFLQKYNDNNKNEITIFGTLKLLLPVILMIALIWIVLIISWNIVGLPLGISSYATL